jgi:phosphohistidine phosphatase
MKAQPFELYLIRHGVAAERGENYPDDAKRPLTNEGVQKLRKEAKALVALDITLDVILTSPLARTRQTAEIVAAAFRNPPPIVPMASLAPGSAHNAIIEELSKQHRRHHIALVGHEPGLGELAGRLIGSRRPLEFKKGAVCRIDVESLSGSGGGTIRWFATPRMLRSLGRE